MAEVSEAIYARGVLTPVGRCERDPISVDIFRKGGYDGQNGIRQLGAAGPAAIL